MICPDDVIDYMVMEAVKLKVDKEDFEAQEEAEQRAKTREFKKDFSSLDQFR